MATHAFGTSFKWNNAVVAALSAINGIELKRDSIDVTTHQSTDGFKQSIPGLAEAGEISIEGFFDHTDTAGQQAMLTDFNSGTIRTAIIDFPASIGCSWSVPGFISGIKIGDAKTEDGIPFSATIQPTGKPTFTIATSAGLTTPFFALSNDAVITPAAFGAVYDYVATVLTGVSVITVTPTASAGTITVNGNVVKSGQASSAIALGAAGSVTEITIVVQETNKAAKTYTIRVARAVA